MMSHFKIVLAAGLMASGLGFVGAASAMPAQGLQTAISTSEDGAPKVENVRLICPPFRPCYYAPGFYRPYYGRYYGRPYGFYRPYGRPFRRGFY